MGRSASPPHTIGTTGLTIVVPIFIDGRSEPGIELTGINNPKWGLNITHRADGTTRAALGALARFVLTLMPALEVALPVPTDGVRRAMRMLVPVPSVPVEPTPESASLPPATVLDNMRVTIRSYGLMFGG